MRDPHTLAILNAACRSRSPLVLPPEALHVIPGATPWGDVAMLSKEALDAYLYNAAWTVSNPRGPWKHAPHIVSSGFASPTAASRPGDLDLAYQHGTAQSDGSVCYANPLLTIASAYRIVSLRADFAARILLPPFT